MTLISTFQINGCPILLGDLLLSEQNVSPNRLIIPTRSRLDLLVSKKDTYVPAGLCQKANLLSPNLAISWAGNKDEAVTFFSEVVGSGTHLNPTLDMLQKIYHDLDNPKELSLIGMMRVDSGIRSFWMNSNQSTTSNPSIKNLVIEGTGQKDFLDLLDQAHFTSASGAPNRLEVAISTTLGYISNLFVSEIEGSISLQQLYGGGYEVIHPVGDHFEKFCNLTYVFWRIEIHEGVYSRVFTPYIAMKYSYYDDLLLIKVIHISGNKLTNTDHHIIKPVFSTHSFKKTPDFKKISFNSDYICSIFEISKNGQLSNYSQIGRYSVDTRPIIFDEDNQGVSGINVRNEFLTSIVNKIIENTKD